MDFGLYEKLLEVSEYTSKDVVDSIIKTFETYWNDGNLGPFCLIAKIL